MEMTNYNKLVNNLEELKLTKIKENLYTYADLVSKKEKNFVDALYEMTEKEKIFRSERQDASSIISSLIADLPLNTMHHPRRR